MPYGIHSRKQQTHKQADYTVGPCRERSTEGASGPVPSGRLLRLVGQALGDTYRALSLWIFHTPGNAIPGFPPGVPAAASLRIG